jgi:hypothetical protein
LKKFALTYLFFSLCNLSLFAAGLKIECEGYFIRKGSKDTIPAKIVVPVDSDKRIQFKKLQWKVTIKDNFSFIDFDKEPSELKEFGFTYNKRKYVYWGVPNPFELSGPNVNKVYNFIFLRLRKPGFCKIFSGYTYEKGLPPTEGRQDEDLILKANNKEWMVVRKSEFINDMNYYFSDCKEIIEKVNNKTYNEKDLEKIVAEYNLFKSTKK